MPVRKPSFESDRFSIFLASRNESYSTRYIKRVRGLINCPRTSPELLAVIAMHEFTNQRFLELRGSALNSLCGRNDAKDALFRLCMHSTAETAISALNALDAKYELTQENLIDLSIFASSTLVRREASLLLQFEKSVAHQQIRRVA